MSTLPIKLNKQMKEENLLFAIKYLNEVHIRKVIDIRYEDGSFTKFLFKLEGDDSYHYTNLTEMIYYYKIMKSMFKKENYL